jgi:hypothetical protein
MELSVFAPKDSPSPQMIIPVNVASPRLYCQRLMNVSHVQLLNKEEQGTQTLLEMPASVQTEKYGLPHKDVPV